VRTKDVSTLDFEVREVLSENVNKQLINSEVVCVDCNPTFEEDTTWWRMPKGEMTMGKENAGGKKGAHIDDLSCEVGNNTAVKYDSSRTLLVLQKCWGICLYVFEKKFM